MDTYFGAKPAIPKLIDLVREREIKESTARTLMQKTNVTNDLISRLGLEKELEGHRGCVNCLQWSDCGEILASASDDKHIFLWNPFRYKKLCSFSTGHDGNIFSVKFMPKSNNSIIVSGAADTSVKAFNLTLSEVLFTCSCHSGRVKRIATAENVPYLFWSAAEDGLVLQHDLRTPHNCMSDRKTILVNLVYHMGRHAEAKCMAVNPARPELVAVGANDPYIRLYDRRMIKIGETSVESFLVLETNYSEDAPSAKSNSNDNIPISFTQYFIAGHLRSRHRENVRNFAATYVTFSSDGTELLANMGGEQIYLFDIMKPRHNRLFNKPPTSAIGLYTEDDINIQQLLSSAYGTDPRDTKNYTSMNLKILPDHVEALKQEANTGFQQEKYLAAVNLYNKALGYCPTAAVLYGNRAAALMKRRWDGDVYAALRDCQTTLLLDPDHVKAHFRLARCLFDLDRPYEAYRVIEDFQEKFPTYVSNLARRALKRDITEAIKSGKDAGHTYDISESLSPSETIWRNHTIDYKQRYCGHCNTTTDIKEANFFGNDGQYIVAGSDDGSFFIWDRHTTNIVRILRGDGKIVNCLQPHPSSCLLATSGIDPVIRLWSPLPEDGSRNEREIHNTDVAASANQIRMNRDPFELMMLNMGYGLSRRATPFYEEDDQWDPVVIGPSNCRPS